jgi:transposase
MSRKGDGLDGDKVEALRRYHALNPHPEKVKDEAFIKEMLRRVREGYQSVTEAAASFGFSRPSFYHAQEAFERGGLGGLLPEPPGPKRAHKLSEEVMDFVERAVEEAGPLRSDDLAGMIAEEFGVSVHPRSVERAISRRKKNG